MKRRVDIGIASYRSPHLLEKTIQSIVAKSTTDWRLFVIDNPSPVTPEIKTLLGRYSGKPIEAVYQQTNTGYAGAVAAFQELAETEYLIYCDNDIEIATLGWDEKLCRFLDQHHECGIVFPNSGHAQIDRGTYFEVLWGVGFCWALNRMAMVDVGLFDTEIGHQEECDYCLRLRMEGWRCAALPGVRVAHKATATSNPESIERINRGVINFVNKWVDYFCGAGFDYHSPNVLRWEDWPPNALYLEEYWRSRLPGLNSQPEVLRLDGAEYDLIRVPRLSGLYRERII